MTRPLFKQITIIGLGLIGGSLGMAIRRKGLARRVVGFARSSEKVSQAIAKKAIHEGTTQLAQALQGSELVILATPPQTVIPLAKRIVKLTRHSFILTDVASTKGRIVKVMDGLLPKRIAYVGSHPMAGSEKSGIKAAKADLFKGATCVVTPTRLSSALAVQSVSNVWKSIDGFVIALSPVRHDRLVAEISHLPHLVAVTLTRTTSKEALALTAGGFADTTRVAMSDPKLWKEIVQMNQMEVIRALNRLIGNLQKLTTTIRRKTFTHLLKELRTAFRIRQQLEVRTRREAMRRLLQEQK